MAMNLLTPINDMAYCTSIIGPMFAGKTTANIKIKRDCEKANIRVLGFKPRCDIRYGIESVFHSHDNDTEKCEVIDDINEVLIHPEYKETKVIILDQGHFYGPSILTVVEQMIIDKKYIVVSGLSGSYKQRSIGYIGDIIALSDTVHLMRATCEYCEEVTDAPFTIKFQGGNSDIQVGSKESYKPVCRKHFCKYEET